MGRPTKDAKDVAANEERPGPALGAEARDPIEELLTAALAFETTSTPRGRT